MSAKDELNNLSQKDKNLWAMRHSAEHVLTMAMENIWGDKIIKAMGPATDDGFYFDFDPSTSSGQVLKISENDFPKIEKEMQKIIKEDLNFVQKDLSIKEARNMFHGNNYKQEWIDEIAEKEKKVSVYYTGKFVDLCSGPHIPSTGKIGPFKLLSIAGAYWRGNEKNKMLTRIYGTCFPTQKELDKHLEILKEAKKRDHRRLGVDLDLFVIHQDIGKGLPLLTPKGTIVRNEILDFERKLEDKAGFEQVWTPHIAKSELYKRTGHWDHYRDVMYAPFGIDGEEYVVKPMNCPHHYMIYASRPRSYKDLPIRLTEPGTCYRYEKSGELGGLTRVRALTIDDSHILMTEDQIHDEFSLCINLVKKMFSAFKLKDYWVRLSLNDPDDNVKYIADKTIWNKAGKLLEEIVKNNKLKYKIASGEASFYGPKIDFMVSDAIGREWQMSTLQLDLFMAKRLNLTYIDKNGKEANPIILHRGLTGSIERTLGILIEHFAGAFPLWLAPVQIKLIPIAERHNAYANKIADNFKQNNIRVEIDERSETMQSKIRDATLQKIPYMGIIGDKEAKNAKLSVRKLNGQDLKALSLDVFVKVLKQEIEEKT